MTWRDVVESELFVRRGLRLCAHQNDAEIDVVRTPAIYSGFNSTVTADIPAAGDTTRCSSGGHKKVRAHA